MCGVDDLEAVARHEAAHAITAIAQGGVEILARVRPANTGGWKGDSTFPDHLPLGRERVVVKLVGLLAQVKLGGAIAPDGHGSDVARARATAIEILQANLDAGEDPTEAQIATSIAVATAVGTRFLESVWDVIEHVAAELISSSPDYVVVNELVDVEDLAVRYLSAEGGLTATAED